MADLMPLLDQSFRQMAGTLACPTEGRLGIASGGRVNQLLQVSAQSLIGLGKRFRSATPPSNTGRLFCTLAIEWVGSFQFSNAGSDRRLRQSRRLSNKSDSAPAKSQGFTGSPEPMETLIHDRSESVILLSKHSKCGYRYHVLNLSSPPEFTRLLWNSS